MGNWLRFIKYKHFEGSHDWVCFFGGFFLLLFFGGFFHFFLVFFLIMEEMIETPGGN